MERAAAAFRKRSNIVLRAGATVVAKYEFIDSYVVNDFATTSVVDGRGRRVPLARGIHLWFLALAQPLIPHAGQSAPQESNELAGSAAEGQLAVVASSTLVAFLLAVLLLRVRS
nr:hypothetical protein GCM10017611_15140 [Rhodococcus wratislaviensis]